MEGSTIFFIVFFGFFFGVLFGYLILFKCKGNLQKKNAIRKINNQKMTYSIGGEKYDFIGKINKDNIKTKVKEITPPTLKQVQKKIMKKPDKKELKTQKKKKKRKKKK